MQIGVRVSLCLVDDLSGIDVDFLEESVPTSLFPERSKAEFSKMTKRRPAGIPPIRALTSFLPARLACIGPEADIDRLLLYAEDIFQRAKRIGVNTIVFDSGRSRRLPSDFPQFLALDQFVDLLQCFGPVARRYGLTLVLKPLDRGECGLVNSHMTGAGVVKKCNMPNVQLLLDVAGMVRRGEPPRDIRRFAGMIRHVHVANSGNATRAPGAELAPYFAVLRESGYDRSISIDCPQKDHRRRLAASLKILRKQLKQAGY